MTKARPPKSIYLIERLPSSLWMISVGIEQWVVRSLVTNVDHFFPEGFMVSDTDHQVHFISGRRSR